MTGIGMHSREAVLAKGLGFTAFYGLFVINWVDLFKHYIPAYSILLGLLYVTPVIPLVLFTDWRKTWPLAVGFALLVSLSNDLGYFVVGDLIFGRHIALIPWFEGQLGLQGTMIVSSFRGLFAYKVLIPSWVMGVSLYGRLTATFLVLRYWWSRTEMS